MDARYELMYAFGTARGQHQTFTQQFPNLKRLTTGCMLVCRVLRSKLLQ